MTRLSATDVSRNFSAVLNRVALGEEVEVIRHGQAVARIAPARPTALSAAAFRALVESAPALDADFAADVDEARRALGPPDDPWPS
jgi:prevent-host-death family protein